MEDFFMKTCEIRSVLWTVTDSHWRHFYFRSTNVQRIQVCYENALYKFTFDIDIDIMLASCLFGGNFETTLTLVTNTLSVTVAFLNVKLAFQLSYCTQALWCHEFVTCILRGNWVGEPGKNIELHSSWLAAGFVVYLLASFHINVLGAGQLDELW